MDMQTNFPWEGGEGGGGGGVSRLHINRLAASPACQVQYVSRTSALSPCSLWAEADMTIPCPRLSGYDAPSSMLSWPFQCPVQSRVTDQERVSPHDHVTMHGAESFAAAPMQLASKSSSDASQFCEMNFSGKETSDFATDSAGCF